MSDSHEVFHCSPFTLIKITFYFTHIVCITKVVMVEVIESTRKTHSLL